MRLTIIPGSPLNGEVTLPGDKSLSHRAALFAALALGESRVENFLDSGVTRAMLNALTALGVRWELNGRCLIVTGRGFVGLHAPEHPLNCGNSATTLRLLTGALAAVGIPAVLDGSPSLRSRPMGRIVEPLRQMGVEIEAVKDCAPLTLHRSRQPLKPLEYTMPVASAQVKTCLLLAALGADGPSSVIEPALSRDHTERMLRSMGVNIRSDTIPGQTGVLHRTVLDPARCCPLLPLNLTLPGDFSSAAFLIVAALITPGSLVKIRGVGLNSARTGLLDALLSMGAKIKITSQTMLGGEPAGDLIVQHSPLLATRVGGEQVVRMIDEFPIFAIAASFARGDTTVEDASELRLKESDRISALVAELSRVGVQAQERNDGFFIQGGEKPAGGTIQPHGDHRLAMSLAVLGLAATSPVMIENAEIMEESFPGFVETFRNLGAKIVES
ncbi:MAG TPA: 3-phosphoshikimate 1-carboxyvinyltransferase [Anaerolineaceae bacterium]